MEDDDDFILFVCNNVVSSFRNFLEQYMGFEVFDFFVEVFMDQLFFIIEIIEFCFLVLFNFNLVFFVNFIVFSSLCFFLDVILFMLVFFMMLFVNILDRKYQRLKE